MLLDSLIQEFMLTLGRAVCLVLKALWDLRIRERAEQIKRKTAPVSLWGSLVEEQPKPGGSSGLARIFFRIREALSLFMRARGAGEFEATKRQVTK